MRGWEHHFELALPIAHHGAGLELMVARLRESGVLADMGELVAIGHRVVHGGEAFQRPTRVDEAVIAVIRDMIPLAPLHNPANLEGIEVAIRLFPGVPQVAVFDTAFHQTMPPAAYRYALPENLCSGLIETATLIGGTYTIVRRQAGPNSAGHVSPSSRFG
ncbi:MAG: hypothetical protein WAT36_09420 [Chromatiaceae bacterium]